MGFMRMKDGDIEQISSDKDVQDPFNLFGHGIQAYFRMMRLLMLVFAIITLLFLPVMYLYYQGGAFKATASILNQINLGNLGHSENICVHQFSQQKISINLQCNKGVFSDIVHMGLMPQSYNEANPYQYDYCAEPEMF